MKVTPVKRNRKWNILNKDVLEALSSIKDNSFDAVLCDPPYEIAFMSKKWDGSGVAFRVETWAEILRVLKPGGHVFAFGGARTHHRLMVAMEDAGFELREVVMYCFGSGFPKGLDVGKNIDKVLGAVRDVVGNKFVTRDFKRADSDEGEGFKGQGYGKGHQSAAIEISVTAPATEAAKLWDGYGSALKPAYEPCVLARKPLTGTIASNCLEHGCGGIWIDGGRVDAKGDSLGGGMEKGVSKVSEGWDRPWRYDPESIKRNKESTALKIAKAEQLGRFPANLILDSSPEVEDCFPHTKSGKPGIIREGKNNGAAYGSESRKPGTKMTDIGDSGSASRFFQYCDFTPEELAEYRSIYYTAKASQKERNAGLEGRNVHPTVKPLSLCEYLAKLILPPAGRPQGPRRILVPFSGSGSEMIGAGMAGWDKIVGIEKESEYVSIAKARLKHWLE